MAVCTVCIVFTAIVSNDRPVSTRLSDGLIVNRGASGMSLQVSASSRSALTRISALHYIISWQRQ
jgi:hypothetical protein